MRSWYVIYDGKEYKCRFISVNVLKLQLYLQLDGKTFKVELLDKKNYEYAKRGNECSVVANTRSQYKACKIVFK